MIHLFAWYRLVLLFFYLNTLGKQSYHSSMHYPSCTKLKYHVKVPWRPGYVALIKCALIHFYRIYFWHGSTVYCSWPCLFTVYHGYIRIRNIFYIWEICFFDLQVFLQLSHLWTKSFIILPWSLKSISTKSISVKSIRMKSMYLNPHHSFIPHTLWGIF